MSKEPRFFVDNRTGCVAVRDRTLTDPEEKGLWPDTKGVIELWLKRRINVTCETCGHTHEEWDEGSHAVAQATLLAAEMNARNPQ